MEKSTEQIKQMPAPEIMLSDFKDVIDENGLVGFDNYGASKEPAALRHQAEELFRLFDGIQKHPEISIEDKEEIGERMVKARNYLDGILSSGRN